MVSLLARSPLLVLFAICAAGYLVGKVKIRGVSLGVAAVLFVGLFVGALAPVLKLPELVQQLGLVLFVYTVGLASGPGFFASLRRRGLATNAVAVGSIALGALVTVALAKALGLASATAGGLFAGGLTNTPALASIVESLQHRAHNESVAAMPVVAYSIAYPGGVLGVLAVVLLLSRAPARAPDVRPSAEPLEGVETQETGRVTNLTIRVTAPAAIEHPLDEALAQSPVHGHIVASRVKHEGSVEVPSGDTVLHAGDLVNLVGTEADLRAAAQTLGARVQERLDLDRAKLDFRRMFVSDAKVVGVTLGELDLHGRFGAVVTRIRRGDVDIVADDDATLELGDRVRVVAPRDRMRDVGKLFGDSYRAVAEVDVITFGLGIALGLLIGSIPIPLGRGESFTLGLAGGPLVAGLVLGRVGRTGPLAWSMPYASNLTLRQLGLVLFLAGVGSRSGYAFVSTLMTADGPKLIVAGALVTLVTAGTAAVLGLRFLKIPRANLLGVLSGLHTQPAALAFAVDRTKSEQPNVGYATVFPAATIAKILLAQLVLALTR